MFRKVMAIGAVTILVGAVGCGGGLASVGGVVTLDGNPVEGATVTFMKVDDKQGTSANGLSDASGNFKLNTNNKPGAPPGDYKVVVIKVKAIPGIADMKPGSPEYMKMMEEKMKQPGAKPGMPPVGAGAAPKSELPIIYAALNTTPLTAKIPSSGPIKVELKSK